MSISEQESGRQMTCSVGRGQNGKKRNVVCFYTLLIIAASCNVLSGPSLKDNSNEYYITLYGRKSWWGIKCGNLVVQSRIAKFIASCDNLHGCTTVTELNLCALVVVEMQRLFSSVYLPICAHCSGVQALYTRNSCTWQLACLSWVRVRSPHQCLTICMTTVARPPSHGIQLVRMFP